MKKANAYNLRQLVEGAVEAHHLTRLTSLWQSKNGLTVDGMLGPETLSSVESGLVVMGDSPKDDVAHPQISEPSDQQKSALSPFEGPLSSIPSSRQEIYDVFGDPGPVGKPNKLWKKHNLVSLKCWPALPPRRWVTIHRLVEPYLREALRRTALISSYEIKRCGGYVHRHVQNDSGKPLSLHSFGIAVDINPADNKAKRFRRGFGPNPWSDEWFRHWPNGVDSSLVRAFESVGFTWGGVWGVRGGDFEERAMRASFFDPQHFEFRIRIPRNG